MGDIKIYDIGEIIEKCKSQYFVGRDYFWRFV